MNTLVEVIDYLIRGNPPGLQRRLVHTWPWPHTLAIALLLVSVAVIGWIYFRERVQGARWHRGVLVVLRTWVIGLTIFGLMYGWMLARDVTDLPDLILVLDDSGSMLHTDAATADAAGADRMSHGSSAPQTRWDRAKRLLLDTPEPLLAELQARYNVHVYRVASTVRQEAAPRDKLRETLREAEIDAEDRVHASSRLGAGLRAILENQRGRPTAAVVMLTDGITTEGRTLGEAANYAQRMDVPLFLIGMGDDRPARDVRLSDLLSEEVVFVGDIAHFDVKLSATGFEGQELTLQLIDVESNTPLATRQVVAGADGEMQTVRLSYRPTEVGDFEVAVEVELPPGDVNPGNNRLTTNVSVRDESIRVLYVQEYPSFEFRFLKNLLERGLKRGSEDTSKAIDLTVILQEADLEYSTIDASAQRVFPVSRDELFEYDVVIFGDVNPAFFSESQLANLADFVRQRGGGIIFSSGTRHTPLAYRDSPLAELMPIHVESASIPPPDSLLEQPITMRPTSVGLSSVLTQLTANAGASREVWESLPPLYWTVDATELKPGARVLVEAVGASSGPSPVVCMQFVGAGKVVMVLTDETYRWAHDARGSEYFASFWLQLVRYLSRAKLLATGGVELATDKDEYRLAEPVSLRVRFFDDRMAPAADDGVTVVVEQESAGRRRITLHRDSANRGLFYGLATNLPKGQYRAWLAEPATTDNPAATRFTVQAAEGERGRLEMDSSDLREAAQVSGGRYYPARAAGRLLEELPKGRQVRIESLPPEPLWNSSFLVLLVIGLLTAEWLLRKRWGLL